MESSERINFEGYSHRRRLNSTKFSSEELKASKKYLKNPTGAGIWLLEAKWIFNSSISNEIKEAISKGMPGLKPSTTKIVPFDNDIDSLKHRTESISFYLNLFTRLVLSNDEAEVVKKDDIENDDNTIINLLDLEALSIKHKDALAFFTKNIYKSDIITKVGKTAMTTISGGSFICNVGPRDLQDSYMYRNLRESRYGLEHEGKMKIELVSLSHDPLKNMMIFFEKLKLVIEPDLYAVFSPEEQVLSPYVDILSKVMPYLLPRGSDIQFFSKMISDYGNRNYTGCISTAGLIAEDCLTQVYETIYRSPVPRKMMIGALRHKIGEAARNRDVKDLDRKDVAKLLGEYKNNNKTDPVRLADISSKLLLRYIDEKYRKVDSRVDNIEGEIKDDEFFPYIVRMNLEDIIRFRNSVSHKSLDPIGAFEALKSIYCSFSLVAWWDEEKKKIDWNQSQKEIVKQFVSLAKVYMNS